MCTDNSDYEVSLEIGKVYRALPSGRSSPPGWLRVVDESGEDYYYPAKRFVPIELSRKGRQALLAASTLRVGITATARGDTKQDE